MNGETEQKENAAIAEAGKAGDLEEKIAAKEAEFKCAAEEKFAKLAGEVKPYIEKYKSGGEELSRLIAEKVRENPGLALAIAFGAGLVAARLLDRRKD